MTGAEVKLLIRESGVLCWQVAERFGMNDGNFSRRLRKPFSADEVEKIRLIISEIQAKEKPSE